MVQAQAEVVQLTDTRHYETLIATLTNLEQQKEDCKWQIGDTLVEYLQPYEAQLRSEERTEFFKKVASSVGRSVDTMRWRYRTSQSFPDDTRAQDFTWDFHRMCASSEGRAQEWLDVSVEFGLRPKHLKKLLKSELTPDEARQKIEENLDPQDYTSLDKTINDMTPPPQSVKAAAKVMMVYGEYGENFLALVPEILSEFTLTDGEEVEIVIRRKAAG